MSHCSKPFSVDFLEFLMKRRHQSNLKKTAHKCIKNVKINIIMKKKQLILTLILGPISYENNVPKHLINLL